MFDPEKCTPEQYEEIAKIVRLTLQNPGGAEGRCIAHGIDSDIMEGCVQLLEQRGGGTGVDIGLGFLLCLSCLDYNREHKEIVI